jgi:hypothetical protein
MKKLNKKITKEEVKEIFLEKCHNNEMMDNMFVVDDENWEDWFRLIVGETVEEYMERVNNQSIFRMVYEIIKDSFKNLFKIT